MIGIKQKSKNESRAFALSIGVIFVLLGFFGNLIASYVWYQYKSDENTTRIILLASLIIVLVLFDYIGKLLDRYTGVPVYTKDSNNEIKDLIKYTMIGIVLILLISFGIHL